MVFLSSKEHFIEALLLLLAKREKCIVLRCHRVTGPVQWPCSGRDSVTRSRRCSGGGRAPPGPQLGAPRILRLRSSLLLVLDAFPLKAVGSKICANNYINLYKQLFH